MVVINVDVTGEREARCEEDANEYGNDPCHSHIASDFILRPAENRRKRPRPAFTGNQPARVPREGGAHHYRALVQRHWPLRSENGIYVYLCPQLVGAKAPGLFLLAFVAIFPLQLRELPGPYPLSVRVRSGSPRRGQPWERRARFPFSSTP